MSVKIRLTRTGARNSPCYRVVAADTRSPRDGGNLEILGWYDPKKKDGENFDIKVDRIADWQARGAKVSATVNNLLKKARTAQPASE